MLPLDALVQSIGAFKNWSHAEKIMLFAWHSQSQPNKGRFNSADVRKCYQDLRLEEPSSISPFLNAMASSKPKKALKKSPGLYCLERSISDQYDARYLQRPATVYVHKLLADLPTKLHDATEQAYMDEAIVCFRNGAFRAAVVMTWNVAYDHLCQYVLTHRLSDFNAQLPLTYPKSRYQIHLQA